MKMRKQVLAVTIGVLLVLSVFSVLQFWQIKPVQAGYQTITHVAGQSGRNSTQDAVFTLSMALTPISGNVLIAVIGCSGNGNAVNVTSITETNVVWTHQVGINYKEGFNSGDTESIMIWYGVVSTSASTTVTIVLNTTSHRTLADIYEYSGLATTSFLDETSMNHGHTTSTDTGTTATTTQTGELWIGGIAGVDGENDHGSPTNGFTLYDGMHNTTGYCVSVAYLEKIVSSAGVANSGTTLTAGLDWVGCIATFKAAVAGSLTQGDGVASTWTYRISQNTTSCYLINNTGAVWDHGTPDAMINNAIYNSSAAGLGSIYVYPDTYNVSTAIGKGGTSWDGSNVYLQFGDGTIINRTSGAAYEGDPMLCFTSYGTGITNITVTSNGTAYFKCNNCSCGLYARLNYNCTYSNLYFSDSNTVFGSFTQSRYCNLYNVTVFSWDETYYGGGCFMLSDAQYCNVDNVTLDGNNQPKTRIAFYIGDWDSTAGWNGSYFNTIQRVWLKNFRRDGFYLNSGGTGFGVYNNTLTNCTVENNWENGYQALKFRPAQNNTVTQLVIRNVTNGVTTGTSYDSSETPGNCTGNRVTATMYGTTETSLVLTADGSNQSVSDNFFNLTTINGKGNYFACVYPTSPIKNNIVYTNFTDCSSGLYFEQGNFSGNVFFCNFTRCGGAGHPDIWHYAPLWGNIRDETINVYATSGNPNGLYDFANGTQNNYVYYPYSYSGPPPTLVSITITSPTNTTYTSSSITVTLSASCSGSTIDQIWWNCKNGSSYIYGTNQTYTVPTQMTGFLNGIQYTFYAFANATDGTSAYQTVMFSVSISAEGITSIIVNTWWSNYW